MAGRASLSFLGQEDISLSGDPQVTYFIEKYQGQTPFAYRVDKIIFDEAGVSFGSQNHRIIPRSGDLITGMTLYTAFPTPPPGVQVLDSVGTLMFQYIELYIGTELIERLYGEFIEMTFDLTVPKGKQPALSFLDGKNLTFSTLPQLAYTVPIPFSTFKKGLPLCAFKEDVTIRIVWNPSTYFTVPPTLITTPFIAQMNIEYTYLSEREINYIRQSRLQVFEQVQLNQFFAQYPLNNFQCRLNFYNPVKELFFVLQQDSARGYDYSNTATAAATTSSIGTGDLLNQLKFDFNTTTRIEPTVGTPQFLRIIQPLEFHTRVPDRLFYMYSFSLDPEGESPTGSVNLSRIQAQNLYLSLNPNPTNVNVRVYAVSYNFLETSNNSAKVTFSNFF
jgi:Large eukaryotic DNA virus major capsid protein/Major capsid protein N-terminus